MTSVSATTTSRVSLFLLELGFVFIASALAFCSGRRNSRVSACVELWFGTLARRRTLAVVTIGILAASLRILFLPRIPIPEPFITSDFSFLLAADTFASGRLTNPTHPMWVHFETLHVTQRPTYMSMYFPAQGMLLAAGKVLAGHPWWGVWASVAVMCAAICWMLQAWVPPGWALLGASLAVLRLGLFSYWIDSYAGGAIAATAGALVFGALPRIFRRFRTRDFFWMALGMALLLLSRPYEGGLICAPAFFVLCWYVMSQSGPAEQNGGRQPSSLLRTLLGGRFNTSPPRPAVVLRRSAPAITLLLLTIGAMAFYNYRVFGNALTLPYTVNRATYAVAPHFLWQSPRPEPVYHHAEMRNFYTVWELEWFLKSRTPSGFVKATVQKLLMGGSFYLGFALALPLLAFPRVIRDRRIRLLLVTSAFFVIGMSVETWLLPHYAAPFTAILYAILLQCMRHLRIWRPQGRFSGAFLVRTVPITCTLLVGLRLYAEPLKIALTDETFSGKAWFGTAPRGLARAGVLAQLEADPGAQLAIVRYLPTHNPVIEWVYNAADIDNAKVVWAQDMNPKENQELLRYFKNRQVWLVEPDLNPPRITPYRIPAQGSREERISNLTETSAPR